MLKSLFSRFKFKRVLNICLRETGSSVVEFVVFAIPLFIPLIFFVNNFAARSFSEIEYQNIARQSLRAFVTSSDYETGVRKIAYILDSSRIVPVPKYKIYCPTAKCFTPGSIVTIELFGSVKEISKSYGTDDVIGSQIVLAKLSERFDEWRDG